MRDEGQLSPLKADSAIWIDMELGLAGSSSKMWAAREWKLAALCFPSLALRRHGLKIGVVT